MKAAGLGHLAVVRYLVAECGADVRGITALMRADTEEHLDIVRYLTRECGADVNATDSGEATILMRVAAKGRLAVVQCLVEDCGARVNAIDWYGETALLKAAGERHLDVVRYLAVKCGADVNTISSREVTALMEAASKGSIDVVRCLAEECRASVDVVNGSGTSAVMLAAQSGQLHVVRYLAVECRANVNATDKNGDTALLGAALQGHFDTARFLAGNCEADLDVTALTKAAARGCFYAVRFLVEERRVDTSATDISGATVLMTAAQHGHIHIVRYLVVTCKGDVNVADKYGDTPLTKASANGHFDVVRALVREYGADVSTTNNTGTTPLMLAAQHGHVDIVRYLAGEHAVDVNAADISGTNALMIAAQYGHIGVVHYLAGDRGADANATNSTRTTALMIAAQYGNMDVVRHLATQYRANVNAANADGYTAIRFAAERGHEEIQRFLTRFLVVHQAGGPETRTARSVPSDATVNNTPSWFIPPSEISLVSFVETGNIGGEYQAKWLDADAAVKLFVPDASSHVGFEHEVHFWHRLRHPNVIKMYGACDASPLPLQFFVCEYASNGSLLEYTKLTPPEEQRVWTFLHQAALRLEYLHEREIIHGDLRCSNILIGSDGLAKLANFARSNSMHQIRHGATLSRVGSVRWQPPEVLKTEALSFASDVYSLGMCILEAVTKGVPWKDIGTDYMVRDCKLRWSPENADEDGKWAPKCLSANARDLVWLMCCQDPKKRASLSSVVHKLERLALRDTSRSFQPEQEPPATYDDYNYPARKEVWMDVQECIQNCDNDLYRLAYMELEKVRECLQKCPHTLTMFQRFHTLVRDFRTIITSSSERARILQLSATRATNSSMTAFRRRLQSLRTALGEADSAVQEREARWEQQHNKQIEIFVSEASKTYLLLEELTSPEERLMFLASLKAEMENPLSKYTRRQLDLLKEAYNDIASRLEADDHSSLTPDWFIPWFELIIDKYDQLGSGGFGSVFRAKWLDSEVVVKVLIKSGAAFDVSCTSLSYTCSSSSVCQSAATTANAKKREETMAVFRREVDIWFRLSHPHVVRLFGACHVGRPFFVCEFATNGTLVSYLRKHPDELWAKLHEAALGVQYLHARNVVHGDLKGNNIVIGSDKKAKVTDFGLSAITNDGVDPRISGASHWVAPECFINELARPNFESDIYALGMCIVEALRVVAAGEDKSKTCLPWGALDNFVARCHATQGQLPEKPPLCTDDQWKLVQRMCVFEPTKRLMISTVVDELATMANIQDNSPIETSLTDSTDPTRVLEVITTTQKRLARRQGAETESAVLSLYVSLWDHLEQVYLQIDNTLSSAGLEAFCLLVAEADESTKNLKATSSSLVALTETTQRCYALQRRLEKFTEAHFQW
ncbi:hypothetical protein PF004_g15016 [Phytophthora fragariae]|uniref:Protein kinase domain-containing protein n=1 Tax=Phytophthora fragariae TaxID=53985 RepID=A0A6G0NML5_9STRA|nr:hypothetical protein PF004_g15016 [Phytophthora fragariae]